jgi:hypothetical protein
VFDSSKTVPGEHILDGMQDLFHIKKPVIRTLFLMGTVHSVLDGYCSTVQGSLDWFEVDLGFPELFLFRDV